MRSFFSAVAVLLFLSPKATAASCCGGGMAIPSLIAGDEKANLSAEISHARTAVEVSSRGIWQEAPANESIQTLRLSGSHIFLDRFLTGVSVPIVTRSQSHSSNSGLGDTILNIGYEALPDWEYSTWRPKGITYLSLTLPTQQDGRGRGFWTLGAGVLATKNYRQWDFFLATETHYSFAKETPAELRSQGVEGESVPGWGGSAGLGTGYNIRDTRLGGAVNFVYEDAISTRGTINSTGSFSRYASLSASLSRVFLENWSAALTYSDQTLLGAPLATSLNRSFVFMTQRRFSR